MNANSLINGFKRRIENRQFSNNLKEDLFNFDANTRFYWIHKKDPVIPVGISRPCPTCVTNKRIQSGLW